MTRRDQPPTPDPSASDIAYVVGEGIAHMMERIDEYEDDGDDGSANIMRTVIDAVLPVEDQSDLYASAPDLAAENARLREALEECHRTSANRGGDDLRFRLARIHTAARKALKGGK